MSSVLFHSCFFPFCLSFTLAKKWRLTSVPSVPRCYLGGTSCVADADRQSGRHSESREALGAWPMQASAPLLCLPGPLSTQPLPVSPRAHPREAPTLGSASGPLGTRACAATACIPLGGLCPPATFFCISPVGRREQQQDEISRC